MKRPQEFLQVFNERISSTSMKIATALLLDLLVVFVDKIIVLRRSLGLL